MSVERLSGVWRVRWREAGRGSRQRSRTFETEEEARCFDEDLRVARRLSADLPGARRRRSDGVSGVYFLEDLGCGRTKIGRSYDLARRLTSNAWTFHPAPEDLVLARVIVTPRPTDLERRLHDLLDAHRLSGEWFAAAPIRRWLDVHSDDEILALIALEDFVQTTLGVSPQMFRHQNATSEGATGA